MWLRAGLFIALLGTLASTAGCTTYQVQQASLVPAATGAPPPQSQGLGDAYVGNSTVTFLSPPSRKPDEKSGLYLPKHQLDGTLSFRWREWGGIRLRYVHGFHQGAQKTYPTNVEAPEHRVWGLGAGPFFRVIEVDSFELFVGFDLLAVEVPTATVIDGCVEHCPSEPSRRGEREIDKDVLPWFNLHVTGAINADDWGRFFLSATILNHITNDAVHNTTTPEDAEPRAGDANLVATFGGELYLGDVLSVVPTIQYPIVGNPVRYGPIISIGVRATFGDTPGQVL